MKHAFLGIALLLVCAGGARAQQARTDSLAVAQTVAAFHAALARGDSAGALALLSPDATVLEAGGVETLADYRAHHLPADIEFARAVAGERGEVRVTLVGDVAWSVSTSRTRGTFRGRELDSVGAELMVHTKTTSGWRIRAIHWSSRARSR